MRVIAGKYRSRPLQSLPGMDIRPTSDRLRETLFDILCAGNPQALEGTVWVDLYAGTGAVGIEALSRGAAHVTFVEKSAAAAALIQKNLKSLGIESGFVVMRSGVGQAIAKADGADYVFLDPPYRMEQEYGDTLGALAGSKLKGSSLVIAEHDRRFDPGEEHGGLRRYRELKQGDAGLSFYRVR
jgi:16S rRNA (guanine966-N2)-methyltransferase